MRFHGETHKTCLIVSAALLGLSLLCFGTTHAEPTGDLRFPEDSGYIHVKRDFGAVGDGKTDDTKAIQAAILHSLSEDRYVPEFIYFPKGTYLVSDTLWNRNGGRIALGGKDSWGDGWRVGVCLIGESRSQTVIRLKDRCKGYGDPDQPKPVIHLGSEMHGPKGRQPRPKGHGNSGFRNQVLNLTIDTGIGNDGAIGLSYIASNRGSVSNVTIRTSDPNRVGVTGLDMTIPWPGPALITNVLIEGFDVGIAQDRLDASMTYEHVLLREQRVAGIKGKNPFISMRGIVSRNATPAIIVTGGESPQTKFSRAMVTVQDSTFVYTGTGRPPPAVVNGGGLLLKNVKVEGYSQAVENRALGSPKRAQIQPRDSLFMAEGRGTVDFYLSRAGFRLFDGPESIPDLPVKDTPLFHTNDFSRWANVRDYEEGSRTGGIQEAIDSGAEIVYLPNGAYDMPFTEEVVIRGNVRKIMGFEARFTSRHSRPVFRFDGTGHPDQTVNLEHLIKARFIHNSDQTLVLRRCEGSLDSTPKATGELFIEDCMVAQPDISPGMRLWARQLNSEYGTERQFTNRGGKAWILGMKTEGHTGQIYNLDGAVTECYGLYSMTQKMAERQIPYIENVNGDIAVTFRDGGQRGYWIKVKETQGNETRTEETWFAEFLLYLGGGLESR